jgi:hypothetical protein
MAIIDDFIRAECEPYVIEELRVALASEQDRVDLTFNVYDVRIDRTRDEVEILDVLDASESGRQVLKLAEFARWIEHAERSRNAE